MTHHYKIRLLSNRFDIEVIDDSHRKDFGLRKIQQRLVRLRRIWEDYEKGNKRTENQKKKKTGNNKRKTGSNPYSSPSIEQFYSKKIKLDQD